MAGWMRLPGGLVGSFVSDVFSTSEAETVWWDCGYIMADCYAPFIMHLSRLSTDAGMAGVGGVGGMLWDAGDCSWYWGCTSVALESSGLSILLTFRCRMVFTDYYGGETCQPLRHGSSGWRLLCCSKVRSHVLEALAVHLSHYTGSLARLLVAQDH
jgi:hypothetical protein